MLPYERSLVARMEGRPFVLLGINCDEDKETLQQVGFRHELNWRNWWNGGSSGPFTALYGVKEWPATFVLDGEGVIRYRNLRGPALEQAVENLLRETEQQRHS
jgi:hypothetical protein